MEGSWTGERLDDLNRRVEDGFRRVDADLREMRGEMNTRFGKADADLRELRSEINVRFDTLQRTMIQLGGMLIAALIGLIATQL